MDMTKDNGPRKALGRGLAALIPSAGAGQPVAGQPVPGAQPLSASSSGLRMLPIERVIPNKTQPRKVFNEEALSDLASSIAEKGVLQPIVVRRRGDNYEIVAGERRWRASSRAGLHEIPAIVKEFSDSESLQVALIENIQRQDLDPIEEAEAYGRLITEYDLTQDDVALAVGKSRVTVTNALRLLKLPAPVLAMLADGRLTAGHARALLTVNSTSQQEKLANDVATRKLSVRDTERLARQIAKDTKPAAVDDKKPSERSVEERLMRALGTKVRLKHRNGKGRLEIHFHSLDQLDQLLDKLAK